MAQYFELKEKDEVWALNDAQLEKLRMLSVASIARSQIDLYHESFVAGDVEMKMADSAISNNNNNKRSGKKKSKKRSAAASSVLSISYARLAAELGIPENDKVYDGNDDDENKHMRQLEDLLIQCIYSNIIAAKLDQSSKCLKIEPHILLAHEPLAGGPSKGGGRSKKESVGGGAGVHGSIFSRDLNTTTPDSTQKEVSRMISSLQSFLKQSNHLLTTLESSSKLAVSDRKLDEVRWRTVQKHVEDRKLFREASSASASGGGALLPHGPMLVGNAGFAAAMAGGGEIPMEVADVTMGRRQVKRSKGGHSMVGGGGGGNVRFG